MPGQTQRRFVRYQLDGTSRQGDGDRELEYAEVSGTQSPSHEMIFTSRWPVAKVNRQSADFPVRSNLRICEVSSMVVGSGFNRCCGLESPRSDSPVCNRGGDFECAPSAGAENSSVQGFEPIGIDGSQAS